MTLARKILTAEAGSRLPDLKVDERIEIQWQQILDEGGEWSDEVRIFDPTWEITKPGEKFSYLDTYGTIVDESDRRWVLGALDSPGSIKPPPYAARVNEVELDDQKKPRIIKIEILTGPDAEAFLRTEKLWVLADRFKENWHLILIATVVGYWWFF